MSGWQATPHSVAFAIGAFLCTNVALVAWRRRPAPGATALAWIMIGCCEWLAASMLQWASPDLDGALFWFATRFAGTEILCVGFFAFTAAYRRRAWLTPRLIALLSIVPTLSVLLAMTNAWHHSFFRTAQMSEIDGIAALDVSFGQAFWAHTAYDYVLLFSGLYLLAGGLGKSPRAYRGQRAALVIATLAPLSANAITLAGHSPFPHMDLTPFGFTITGVTLLAGFFRFSLFEIIPAARDRVIEHMSDAVFVLDEQDRIVDLNPAAQRLLGPRLRAPIGMAIHEALPALALVLEEGFSGGTLPKREVTLTVAGPSGVESPRDCELHASPVVGRDGRQTGRVLLLHDVTEHKQTRERLRQSEETYNTILETIEDGYYELDLAGRFTMVTTAAAKIASRSREETIGMSFAELTDEATALRLFEVYKRLFRTGEPVRDLEYSIVAKGGEPRVVEASGTLVRDAAGKPIGFRGICRDVTARKRAERELREAKEIAEEASRAKGAFLTTVSHELRTPLTAVVGFAKIIKKRFSEVLLPELTGRPAAVERAARQVAGNVDIIVSEGERLTALINDVLDLAKIESGKMTWQMRPVHVSEVIERAVAATTALAEQKGLQLATEIEQPLPAIDGDFDRLMQVLVNLLSNAVKFTGEGSVTCRARRVGDRIVVGVADTGIGIAREEHEKIFEQFVQVGDTLTGKPTGTGLGLPICQQIVERHGGQIWVESEPGRGSVFSFALPIDRAGVSSTTSPRMPAMRTDVAKLVAQVRGEAGPVRSNGDGRKTILVVDDEPPICALLRQELESAGYEVREAHDGEEALALVRTEKPHLVILDVLMPGLDGFDVAAVLRGDPRTRDIPIIILSVIEDEERGSRLGVEHSFTKPVDTALLVREVGTLLADPA